MSFEITAAMITAWNTTSIRVTPFKNNVQMRTNQTLEQRTLNAGDVFKVSVQTARAVYNKTPTESTCYFKSGDNKLPLLNVGTAAQHIGKFSQFAEVTYNDSQPWDELIIETVLTPQYYLSETDFNQLNSSGVTLSKAGYVLEIGDGFQLGDDILATAEVGRKFYIDGDGNPSLSILSTTGRPNYYFTLSEDKQTASFLVPAFAARPEYWTLSSATEQSGSNVVGTNKVYLLTDDLLKTFTASRYKTLTKWVQTGEQPTEGEQQTEIYDYGEYVLNLISMPFTVPPEIIGLDEGIMLANYNTGVAAPKINSDNIVINLGVISVPTDKNNLLDYSNTVAMLHLPRINPFAIDLEYVLGHTLNIQYVVDVYTGKATVNVFSDAINAAILTKSVDIGVNIPYATSLEAPMLSNSSIEVGGDNGVKTAFIELIKNNSALADGFYSAVVTEDATIGNNKGYIVVDNIDLNVIATSSEKDSIITQLMNGVIIK